MYCQCHMDASNHPIHVVPIIPDGRLSAKYLFNAKSLEQLQSDFQDNDTQFYELERGQAHSKN